jgi:hypothetical protein
MKLRIALWFMIGIVVACSWVIIGMTLAHRYNFGHWPIVAITAPASLLGRSLAMKYQGFIALNGVMYAMAGIVFELLRHQISRLRPSITPKAQN